MRELIVSGALPPGAFVRQERIADELGLSATPIREGLMALRTEGFVRLIPRRGFMVAPLDAADLVDLYEAQALLAGELAARAASRLDDTGRHTLQRLHQAIAEAVASDQPLRVEELNHVFHRTINLAAAAPKMAWILSVSARYAPRRFFARIEGWPSATARDHDSILAALLAEDPTSARRTMEDHIRNAGQLLAAHFDSTVAGIRVRGRPGAGDGDRRS